MSIKFLVSLFRLFEYLDTDCFNAQSVSLAVWTDGQPIYTIYSSAYNIYFGI